MTNSPSAPLKTTGRGVGRRVGRQGDRDELHDRREEPEGLVRASRTSDTAERTRMAGTREANHLCETREREPSKLRRFSSDGPPEGTLTCGS